MKSYIGTKIVQARTHAFVNPDGEVRQGYKVVYDDGYELWSPKEVFERCYREITKQEKEMMK